jgi:hypothetical protein
VKSERNLGAAMPVSFWGGVGHGSLSNVRHCAFFLVYVVKSRAIRIKLDVGLLWLQPSVIGQNKAIRYSLRMGKSAAPAY